MSIRDNLICKRLLGFVSHGVEWLFIHQLQLPFVVSKTRALAINHNVTSRTD